MADIEVVAGTNQVKKTIAVLSGKGGVGKSTTVSLLAVILAKKGFSVGVLDADLCGPSIPVMLGMKGSIHSCEQGWLPSKIAVGNGSISAVSLSFLVEKKDEAVVWRGPKKTAMIKQFVTDVCWGKLDVLLVDTPPGTTDEHMAVVEAIPNSSALLVTSPQAVAAADVLRQVTFCRKVSLNILGVVETLSGFVCPTCADCSLLFNSGGGQRLADHCKIPYLGSIPIDPQLSKTLDMDSDHLAEDLALCASYKNYQLVCDSLLPSLECGQVECAGT